MLVTQEGNMHTNNFKHRTLSVLSIAALGLLMAACGGGGGDKVGQITNKPGTGGGSNDPQTQHSLGFGSGKDFVSGVIGIGIGTDTLSPGGTTSLTVNIVDGLNNLAVGQYEVAFNSRCVASHEATITPQSVSTNNGQISVTYTATGCTGDDEITATTISGNLSARGVVRVSSDIISSLRFINADPEFIYLVGASDTESSRVRFQLTGSSGGPIKDECIDFSLDSSAGGASLLPNKCHSSDSDTATRAKTDANGYATIAVRGGSVATGITVRATHAATNLSTQSKGLYVSSGVPEQKSMSLSVSKFNPPGWDYDGAEVQFTIRLADAFANPPRDGTAVSFTTSGGSIDAGCTTVAGVCNVTWRSMEPKPADGLIRILAHTHGNESFIDTNGNGWYDKGVDIFLANNKYCSPNWPLSSSNLYAEGCDDLGEAFLDSLHQNKFINNLYTFIDNNGDSTYTPGNGIYNGVLCRNENDIENPLANNPTCSRKGVDIRADTILSMSSSYPKLNGGVLEGQEPVINLTQGKSHNMVVVLQDIHGNALPAGTKISVSYTTAGAKIVAPKDFAIGSTIYPQEMAITIIPEQANASGVVSISIETPHPSGDKDGTTTTVTNTFFNGQ